MIRHFAAVAAVMVASAGFAGAAHAYQFGTEEDVHKLVDVGIAGDQGEALYLGYKTSTLFVLLGVNVSDDGYVFGVRDKSDTYYPTTPEQLAKLQAEGALPKPLPPYSLGLLDYLIGYSLWVTLAVIAAVYGVGWLRKRGATPAAAQRSTAAGRPQP